MSLLTPKEKVHSVGLFVVTVTLWLTVPGETLAQQAASTAVGRDLSSATSSNSVDPFAAVERAVATGESRKIRFGLTELDTRAEATAQAALRGQTLLVRVRADNVPVPAHFNVPRYALWVYIPNYRVKMYIGDLPINSPAKAADGILRGESDTAYYFPRLPPDAVFGGLALTAEPVRFEPIINDALRPVLVGLLPGETPDGLIAATTLYSGPVPAGGK